MGTHQHHDDDDDDDVWFVACSYGLYMSVCMSGDSRFRSLVYIPIYSGE